MKECSNCGFCIVIIFARFSLVEMLKIGAIAVNSTRKRQWNYKCKRFKFILEWWSLSSNIIISWLKFKFNNGFIFVCLIFVAVHVSLEKHQIRMTMIDNFKMCFRKYMRHKEKKRERERDFFSLYNSLLVFDRYRCADRLSSPYNFIVFHLCNCQNIYCVNNKRCE